MFVYCAYWSFRKKISQDTPCTRQPTWVITRRRCGQMSLTLRKNWSQRKCKYVHLISRYSTDKDVAMSQRATEDCINRKVRHSNLLTTSASAEEVINICGSNTSPLHRTEVLLPACQGLIYKWSRRTAISRGITRYALRLRVIRHWHDDRQPKFQTDREQQPRRSHPSKLQPDPPSNPQLRSWLSVSCQRRFSII